MRFSRPPAPASVLLGIVLATSSGCGGKTLTVAAAASLSDAFRELGQVFEGTGSAAVSFHFAASGVIEAQVRAGAPISVVATASAAECEALHADGLIEPPVEFARNRLAVAGRAGLGEISGLSDLARADVRRIAFGSPGTVPSGRYAEQALRRSGLWPALEDRLVPCENVRQALAYLVRGEVDAALLYATDLRAARAPLAWTAVPDTLHDPIRYLAAVVPGAGPGVAPHVFLRFLTSEEGQAILRDHGFLPPAPLP